MNSPITFFQQEIFGILLTIATYFCGQKIYRLSGRKTLLQPVLSSMLLIIAILLFFSIPYATYFHSAKTLTLCLGPVTVAMAVPLYQNIQKIRRLLLPIVLTLLVCGTLTVVLAVLIGWLLGVSKVTLITLCTKSISTPFAIMLADQIGGSSSLAAIFVMYTGILGATVGPTVLNLCGIRDNRVRGVTIGLTSHAAGTAIALEASEECGAFSALAMGLMGILTALFLPLLLSFIL